MVIKLIFTKTGARQRILGRWWSRRQEESVDSSGIGRICLISFEGLQLPGEGLNGKKLQLI